MLYFHYNPIYPNSVIRGCNDFVRMSGRLSVGFTEITTNHTKENDREDADKQTKAVGKQHHQRGMQHWKHNDRFGVYHPNI